MSILDNLVFRGILAYSVCPRGDMHANYQFMHAVGIASLFAVPEIWCDAMNRECD
jgi:hypothetical protein